HQTIFLELCSQQTEFPLTRDEPRLLVTHTCSRWRAIALSMPDFWANICIRPRSPHHVLQLDPSTLSLELNYGSNFDASHVLTSVIFPVIHRYSLLSLNFADASTLRNYSRSLLAHYVPPEDSADSEWGSLIPPATAFQLCPQLHTIKFAIYGLRLRIANLNATWHQLTTLQLYMIPILACECLDALRQCTLLRECTIFISPIDSLTIQQIAEFPCYPVVLPSLHRLQLGFILCDTIHELNLRLLSVHGSLHEVLALVPNLKTLWLGEDSHMHPELMHALARGTILPHLTALRLQSVDPHFLLVVLEARLATARADPSVTSFVDVLVIGQISIDEARREALAKAGVQIRFEMFLEDY
ncbi:hypothetical protein BD779DRAFT_1551516, partial [Infundibulicybe gibba]